MADTRLPQSQSCSAVLGLVSPTSSQHRGGSPCGYVFSPVSSLSGNLTELRSYAPKAPTPASLHNNLPPKFDPSGFLASVSLAQHSSHTKGDVTSASDMRETAVVSSIGPAVAVPWTKTWQASRSRELSRLTNTSSGLPSLATALDPANFPFIEGPRMAHGVNYGVVKLKNIPFFARRSEIIAFVGRNAKILNDTDEPVHIIMERITCKTMDAYVEFESRRGHENRRSARPASANGPREPARRSTGRHGVIEPGEPDEGPISAGARSDLGGHDSSVQAPEPPVCVGQVPRLHLGRGNGACQARRSSPSVTLLERLPPAAVRVLDQYHQEVSVVRDGSHHHRLAPCHVRSDAAPAPGAGGKNRSRARCLQPQRAAARPADQRGTQLPGIYAVDEGQPGLDAQCFGNGLALLRPTALRLVLAPPVRAGAQARRASGPD